MARFIANEYERSCLAFCIFIGAGDSVKFYSENRIWVALKNQGICDKVNDEKHEKFPLITFIKKNWLYGGYFMKQGIVYCGNNPIRTEGAAWLNRYIGRIAVGREMTGNIFNFESYCSMDGNFMNSNEVLSFIDDLVG